MKPIAKRFIKRNDGFVCEHCGKNVLPTHHGSPRNHCPFCLWGKHLDINPGDRLSQCQGLLKPIGALSDSRKEYVIVYRCIGCGERKKSRVILHDENQNDDFNLILELSKNPISEE
ncbi:MAG: RNHCP domain-containing protein [Pseudomonadota bacterium]